MKIRKNGSVADTMWQKDRHTWSTH